MIHKRFIFRQLTTTKKQSVIFILCVALSIMTLVALRSFGGSVNRTLIRDARELHAADIIMRSNFPFTEPLNQAVDTLTSEGAAIASQVYEFYSVVREESQDNSLLAGLKVVDGDYPFYGEIGLASGASLQSTLASGQIIVEQLLLDRLGIAVGDSLLVGQAKLTIADVVISEPDRPVNFFSLGPRIFISTADLASLDLIKPGSRVRYTKLLKVADERQIDTLAAELSAVAAEDIETIETYRTAESSVQRFFENFLLFLGLIGIFTLLLAGIGIQSALTAFLRERNSTIAVVKTLGASSRFVTINFLVVVICLGIVGILLGLGAGFVLQQFLPTILSGFLPPEVELEITPTVLSESLLLGMLVVGLFTCLPLYHLEAMRPSFILRKENDPLQRGWPYYATVVVIILCFLGMVIWQLERIRTSLYFAGGVLALLLLSSALTYGTLWLIRRQQITQLALRQALRGLFRPRNATHAIIITLSAALAVLFCIYLIERNLNASLVQSYPDDAPNLFFLDIQPDQLTDFQDELAAETTYFPIIRASIMAINGEPIKLEEEEERGEDNLARSFNITYREMLRENETLLAGQALFDETLDTPQVSVWDVMQGSYPFAVGDQIQFRIQGVPLQATVSSIRKRTDETVEPVFGFVLRPVDLENVPQTIFTALYTEPAEIAPLQNRIVARFPNVSVIDATAVIANLAGIANRLTRVIRFFALFSIVAGLLIVVSSIFATRFARIQEAVYYKVLGAKGRFVLWVFTLENMLLGLVSALLALLLSQTGSWIMSTQLLELEYQPCVNASIGLVILTIMLVTGVGLFASISILRQRPVVFLREQSGEE